MYLIFEVVLFFLRNIGVILDSINEFPKISIYLLYVTPKARKTVVFLCALSVDDYSAGTQGCDFRVPVLCIVPAVYIHTCVIVNKPDKNSAVCRNHRFVLGIFILHVACRGHVKILQVFFCG